MFSVFSPLRMSVSTGVLTLLWSKVSILMMRKQDHLFNEPNRVDNKGGRRERSSIVTLRNKKTQVQRDFYRANRSNSLLKPLAMPFCTVQTQKELTAFLD